MVYAMHSDALNVYNSKSHTADTISIDGIRFCRIKVTQKVQNVEKNVIGKFQYETSVACAHMFNAF